MIEKIRELRQAKPFVRFSLKTVEGREFIISTPDHVFVPFMNDRVLLFDHEDRQIALRADQIIKVEAMGIMSKGIYNMLERIRELLHAVPFVPFKIRTSDGHEYSVPTNDHLLVAGRRGYVIVLDDTDRETRLSGLHIVAVEESLGSIN